MSKKSENKIYPNVEQINKFDMLEEFILALYIEVKDFSKKKPDETLNEFKVKSINRVLEKAQNMLHKQPSSDFLDLLDNEVLPSYSDAILIITQYKASLDQFKKDFWIYDSYEWRWATSDNPY